MRLVTGSENPRASVSFFALWSLALPLPLPVLGARWSRSSCRAETSNEAVERKLRALSISRDTEDPVLELKLGSGGGGGGVRLRKNRQRDLQGSAESASSRTALF